jgi:hypothetical protein
MNLESLRFQRDGPHDRGLIFFVVSDLPVLLGRGFRVECPTVKVTLHGRCKVGLRYKSGKGWHAQVESSDDLPNGFHSSALCRFLNDHLRENFPIDSVLGADILVTHAPTKEASFPPV